MKATIIIIIITCLNMQAQQNTIQYSYDILNRVTRIAYPNGSIIEYSYQANGNRITKTSTGGLGLPIELLTFQAQKGTPFQTILTNWTTQTELNGSHFEVEWSDGQTGFSKIGRVEAVGNTTTVQHYEFLHEQPIIGYNYYRLKCVDLDGSYKYSETKVVELKEQNTTPILVFPNPTKDVVTLRYAALAHPAQLELLDNTGKLITTQTIPKGSVAETIHLSSLPTGVYILKLTLLEQGQTTKTFKVEKVD